MPFLRNIPAESLTNEILESLKSANVTTVESFYLADEAQLSETSKIPRQVIQNIRTEIENSLTGKWRTGEDEERKRTSQLILSSGIQGLDAILGGGIQTGRVLELVGSSSSGKSQICMWTSAHLISKGLGNVVYIDSSGSLHPTRMRTFITAISQGSKAGEVNRLMQSRLKSLSVSDFYGLWDVINPIESEMKEENDAFYQGVKMIVIDSLGSILAPMLYRGSTQGFSLMLHLGTFLQKLAYDHNIAILITNHVVSSHSEQATKPALGASWTRIAHTRILASTLDPTTKSIRLISSPQITQTGQSTVRISQDMVE